MILAQICQNMILSDIAINISLIAILSMSVSVVWHGCQNDIQHDNITANYTNTDICDDFGQNIDFLQK